MKRILWIVVLALLSGIHAAEERRLLICVSGNAPASVKEAAQSLLDVNAVQPFQALVKSGGAVGEPTLIVSETLLPESAFRTAAYNTLVMVGLKDRDALLAKCWGHQAAIDVASKHFYRLGYGSCTGDLGYIECDWNPFLFSNKTRTNAFTTLSIKISGTSEAGVVAAVKAFREGLLNGVVPAGKLTRTEETILDLEPSVTAPPALAEKIDGGGFEAFRAGWTQPAANEYRAFIDAGGVEPKMLWRVKYLVKNVFDDVSGKAWVNGLHRMAYGNAVTIAEFKDAKEAEKALNGIAAMRGAKRVTLDGVAVIQFPQPKDDAFTESYGNVNYYQSGNRVFASSLPVMVKF